MSSIETKRFDTPDEVRTPAKTRFEEVHLHGGHMGRMRLEPGWKWSECIKPIAKTERCEAVHRGFCISGRIHIAAKDGAAADIGPGEAYFIEPGHDAWVVGDEPFVAIEFDSKTVDEYARPH